MRPQTLILSLGHALVWAYLYRTVWAGEFKR